VRPRVSEESGVGLRERGRRISREENPRRRRSGQEVRIEGRWDEMNPLHLPSHPYPHHLPCHSH